MLLFSLVASFLVLGFIIFLAIQRPSNSHTWAPEVAIQPFAEYSGDTLTLRNIRRFRYTLGTTPVEDRFDRTLRLTDILGVDLFIEPFSFILGPAHSFISFRCSDDHHIVISVEVRRQNKQRESSFWLSLFRQYSLIYVVADEEDAVYLRSHIRKDQVYLHPLRLTQKQSQQLFLDVFSRVNELRATPELHNLFWNTCATNIHLHLNNVLDHKIPFHWSLLLPAFWAAYLYRHGLIATELPFEEHLKTALTNHKSQAYPQLHFSQAIRKNLS